MIQPIQPINTVTKKTLRETIRAQKAAIQKLEGNLRILLVMVEAVRSEYNLSQEKVEEITSKFINAHVERDAEGKIDMSEFLGAADGMKEQLMKLKETIANGEMPPIVKPEQKPE